VAQSRPLDFGGGQGALIPGKSASKGLDFMKARHALLIGSVGLCSFTVASAYAQDEKEEAAAEEEGAEAGGDDAAADEAAPEESGDEPSDEKTDEAAKDEPMAGEGDTTEERTDGSPVEVPGKSYMFLGLRYRGIIVPTFMMNMFGEGGDGVYVHAFGPEFSIRKDNFEYNFSVWYADYGMEPTPWKAKDDPIEAYEIVESKLKVLYLTADFLWSSDLSPQFAINYGMGAGVGFVFGDLYRTQAMPPTAGAPTADFVKCPAPGAHPYCDTDNDHYDGYSEPSWADGGSKPIIFPWLALQTGVRFKPHKNFVTRLDLGFGTSGFFFGLGADYGL
jgi:hypothetical protein